jgi:molybdenum transport protein
MPVLDDVILGALLEDDFPCGDLTTTALGIGAQRANLEFRARQALTVRAGEEAVRMSELAGAGADLLLTSAPYTAPPRDVQVDFLRA